MERVTFSNTGTEAVMTAIRLARTVTGRNKIAPGSYHGHFDGTLVKAQTTDGNPQAVPIAPGVPPNIAADVLVLDWESSVTRSDKSPSKNWQPFCCTQQTGRPDLQPKTFLQQLRQLTKESGITLIFDEMVTGFRIHPGGAQAWFWH